MTFYRAPHDAPEVFDLMVAQMARDVLGSGTVEVGEWQARKGVNGETMEVTHARVEVSISPRIERWARQTGANLPWAEDHFKERIGGEPLNPPPSEQWWPFAVQGNADHKTGKIFSHTYPERFWPCRAGGQDNEGIRFGYGDYADLVEVLAKNIHTRQAYLPIWFPEDLNAAREGERVPCTLGYHFLVRNGVMDVEYHIRSCDLVRHFRDDVYMAGRLVYDLIYRLDMGLRPGKLIMNIGSLHAFPPDRYGLERLLGSTGLMYSKYLMEQL